VSEDSRVAEQPILTPLTPAVIFLVVTVKPDTKSAATVRSFLADLSGIIRAVETRDLEGGLACVVGFGSDVWCRLFSDTRPAELHPFREFGVEGRKAVSTPGDILFHVRAKRMDLCFELVTHVMDRIRGSVTVVDETHGFRYFDDRSIIGFVDGTENPRAEAARAATIVGEEDAPFAGGSYVLVQKYSHDMDAWNALSTEVQEHVIGRKKLSDIELSDEEKPANAHNALTVIEEDGREVKILRDNMPYGRPGYGEFGTYFIAYSRSPRSTEQMLSNMFVGNPPGNYDRLLDFSTAITGGLFFVPTAAFLDELEPGD